MIFKTPKTKTGETLEDVTVTYKLNNPMPKKWFVNDKIITLTDLAIKLGYNSKGNLHYYFEKYGIVKTMKYGGDALRDTVIEPKNNRQKVTKHCQSSS